MLMMANFLPNSARTEATSPSHSENIYETRSFFARLSITIEAALTNSTPADMQLYGDLSIVTALLVYMPPG